MTVTLRHDLGAPCHPHEWIWSAGRAYQSVAGIRTPIRVLAGTGYDSLAAASKAQDAEDAHAAYELYKKGDEATPAEIDRLNALFKANQKDPYFAEKFALEVGPKGSMEYWAD
ncbi:hypothetical protein ACWCQ0_54000, partial [Streptomyces massasporeus]